MSCLCWGSSGFFSPPFPPPFFAVATTASSLSSLESLFTHWSFLCQDTIECASLLKKLKQDISFPFYGKSFELSQLPLHSWLLPASRLGIFSCCWTSQSRICIQLQPILCSDCLCLSMEVSFLLKWLPFPCWPLYSWAHTCMTEYAFPVGQFTMFFCCSHLIFFIKPLLWTKAQIASSLSDFLEMPAGVSFNLLCSNWMVPLPLLEVLVQMKAEKCPIVLSQPCLPWT